MRRGGHKAKKDPNTELSHRFPLGGRWFTPFNCTFKHKLPTLSQEDILTSLPLCSLHKDGGFSLLQVASHLQPGTALTFLQVFNIKHIIFYWTLKDSETVPCKTQHSHKFRWWSRVLHICHRRGAKPLKEKPWEDTPKSAMGESCPPQKSVHHALDEQAPFQYMVWWLNITSPTWFTPWRWKIINSTIVADELLIHP